MNWLKGAISNSTFKVNDYTHYSGDNYISHINNNNILNQIDNGLIHEKKISKNEVVKFQVGNLNTIPNYVYTTKHNWQYGRYGTYINCTDYDYIVESGGKKLSLTHIPPQSLRQYRSEYIVPNYNRLSGVVPGSITLFDDSGIYKNNYITNKETYSLDNYNQKVYYGGVFNSNKINIYNLMVREKINNHIIWSNFCQTSSGSIFSCGPAYNEEHTSTWIDCSSVNHPDCSTKAYIREEPFSTGGGGGGGLFGGGGIGGGFLDGPIVTGVKQFYGFYEYYDYFFQWSGFYGFGKLYQDCDLKERRYYAGNLEQQSYTNSFNSLNVFKDSLSYFDSDINTVNTKGDIILDYTCYTTKHSCLRDFYPFGYRVIPTGNKIDDDVGVKIDYYTLQKDQYGSLVGVYPYYLAYYSQHISNVDFISSSILFSSGQVTLSIADTLSGVIDKFSGITPYGVSCYGQPLTNMFLITKGYISSGDLSSGLLFEDFNYTSVNMNLSIKYNKLKNDGGTTGEIDNSGNIKWSHNHGSDLIKYNEIIVGSSILYPSGNTENGIYMPPNHYGEIYRVDYDKKTNSLYTTGNLVRGKKNTIGTYYYMPSSVIHFENSSILMTSGDFYNQFGYSGLLINEYPPSRVCKNDDEWNTFWSIHSGHCYAPTSVFTGLREQYIPTGLIVSNFNSQCISGECSGLLEYKMVKNSLQYLQNQTSDLICGNEILISNSLIKYSGQYPNIPKGDFGLFIDLGNQ